MQLYELDPILDDRWEDLVTSHPSSSVFHNRGWLSALVQTYGYRPIALTSTPPGEKLSDGIVFCEVNSWITGSRLVSLPFADHSDPLLNEGGGSFELADWLRTAWQQKKWKYIELRPLSGEMHQASPLVASHSFWFHTLDLSPPLEQIFHNFHKNCIQRRIRRAERERLSYEKGCSAEIVDDFYRLLLITRRRHKLLPQPRGWFQNLIACMSPNAEIRLVRKGDVPIAAMLTLRNRRTVVYKYGCSDEKFHHLAGMPYLFWKMIEESKAANAEEVDFGRTDLENEGLIRFKDRFGTVRKRINYFRYPQSGEERDNAALGFNSTLRLFSAMPYAISSKAGQLVYRHIG
jgi:CelD/BcsL family acetyltransferase involved in cellulose biosynthesis